MSDFSITGFRYAWDKADANQPNGVNRMQCLVIARAASEAERILVETVTGGSRGLKLISSGPQELLEAQRIGLTEGQGQAL